MQTVGFRTGDWGLSRQTSYPLWNLQKLRKFQISPHLLQVGTQTLDVSHSILRSRSKHCEKRDLNQGACALNWLRNLEKRHPPHHPFDKKSYAVQTCLGVVASCLYVCAPLVTAPPRSTGCAANQVARPKKTAWDGTRIKRILTCLPKSFG